MLAFFGTSRHSAQFLEQVVQNGLKIDLVVSSPPKPVGKEQVLTENPTVTTAKKLNIPPVLNLSNLSNLNVGLILDYNVIIPKEIIDLFPRGIINIHFSKLPKYRGSSPVQHTILNGDTTAWITYYLIDEKIDTGKIIVQTSLPLDLTENTETLYQKLIDKSVKEVEEILDNYLENKITPWPQEGVPIPARKLKTENCQIDWTKPPEQIERLIRAAYPEPGAWVSVQICSKSAKISNERRLKIHKAHLESGKLVLDLVQLEGKNPVTWKQFQQGYPNYKITI